MSKKLVVSRSKIKQPEKTGDKWKAVYFERSTYGLTGSVWRPATSKAPNAYPTFVGHIKNQQHRLFAYTIIQAACACTCELVVATKVKN